MKKEEVKLSNYCRWNDNGRLVKLLKEHRDLDLNQERGVSFMLAIKHNNVDMLNTLLRYYEETKQDNEKLSILFKEAEKEFEISPEIYELIRPYLLMDEDSDSDDESASDSFDLSGFEIQEAMETEDYDSSCYFKILREKNHPILDTVRQNLHEYGFRLPDEINTLEATLTTLEHILLGLKYVYFGSEYETNKMWIEQQITNIKLNASAAVETGDDSQRSPIDFSYNDGAAEDHSADYAEREVMGDDGNGNLAEGFSSPHSPPIIGY